MDPYRTTMKAIIKKVGYANEETIIKYVQDQLTELEQKKIHSTQMDLF